MKNSRDIKLLQDRCHDPDGEIYPVNFTRDRLERLILPGLRDPRESRDLGRYCHRPRVR